MKLDASDEQTLQDRGRLDGLRRDVGDDKTKLELGKLVIRAVKQVMDKPADGKTDNRP